MLYSISAVRSGGDLSIFKKQLIIAAAGLLVALVVSAVNYRAWQSLSLVIYLGTIVLLVLVLIFGYRVHATRGWIGFGFFRFQPVEFAKLAMVIVLAPFFSRRARELNRFSNLAQSFVLVLVPAALVFLQPDFGSAVILLVLWFSFLLIIGVKRRYLFGLLIFGCLSFAFSWFFLFAPYQKERLESFVFPAARQQGQSYNVRQAIIALGSGEITGRGLGAGPQSQLKFLPEAGTDFIFAVVGEELGFIGISILLGLLAWWYYRVFVLLFKCRDDFASFVLLGALLLMFIEIFVSAGMSMGIMPVVGVPFPLLSAGGSSLFSHLLLIGIVAAIARQENVSGYQIS